MGHRNIARLLTQSGADIMLDPGASGTITVRQTMKVSAIVTAAAETRTLSAPDFVGMFHTMYLRTDGGTCTITVTNGYDQAGNTTLTFSDVGDYALLTSINDNGTLRWQVVQYVSGSEAVASETIQLDDSDAIQFGTGSDMQITWDGSGLTSGPPSGMWTGAPSPLDHSPYRAHMLFDDFNDLSPVDASLRWLEFDDGSTGTNAFQDAAGGVASLVTAAADNDYHGLGSRGEVFDLVNAKELWFEARFKLTEATTNDSAWWFGLTDTLTTGGFQTDALGPLGTYDGVMMWKDEDTLLIDGETSNASTQDTETSIATFASGTWTRVAFHVSVAATPGVCTFYYDIDDSGVLTAHGTTANITRSGMTPMHLVMGVKAGPGAAAETLEVDYVKCVQIR